MEPLRYPCQLCDKTFPRLGNLKRHMLRLWIALEQGRPLPEVYRSTREHGLLFDMRATA